MAPPCGQHGSVNLNDPFVDQRGLMLELYLRAGLD